MVRRVWLLAAAVVCLTVVPAASPAPRPQLGFLFDGSRTWLVPIDAATLTVRSGRRLDVTRFGFAWSVSPSGSRLALAGDSPAGPSLAVVDARRLVLLGRVRPVPRGWVRATAWLPGGRLVAVVSDYTRAVSTTVVTIDPRRPRVVARRSTPGQPLRVSRTPSGLVALVAPDTEVGAARLLVVGRSGATRVIVVDRIKAGSARRDGKPGAEFSNVVPGLAVDPAGRRAFVVAADGDVAVVDVVRGRVSYNRVSRTSSAATKSIAGPSRIARWLGNGVLAVSGGDYSVVGAQPHYRPVGLDLIDTRNWTVRRLGGGTDEFWAAGSLLLASVANWSSETQTPRPPGLVVYGADRHERYRLYDGERVWVAHVARGRAFVHVAGRVDVVDLASGNVVERRASAPIPLVGRGSRDDG